MTMFDKAYEKECMLAEAVELDDKIRQKELPKLHKRRQELAEYVTDQEVEKHRQALHEMRKEKIARAFELEMADVPIRKHDRFAHFEELENLREEVTQEDISEYVEEQLGVDALDDFPIYEYAE